MKKSLYLFGLILWWGLISLSPAVQYVPGTDKNIQYWGRTYSDGTNVFLNWPASTIKLKFTGSRIKLVLGDPTLNTFWVKNR